MAAAPLEPESTASRPPSSSRSTTSTSHGYRAVLPWGWEGLTWLLAAGLLVAIYLTLNRANNKPVDAWNFVINLNSLAAILSTFFRALLVTIAAEILSQQKWIWFWSASSPARPLRHLQDFDNGSRGVWGALGLLPIVVRGNAVAVLAALVIIVSFAIGPFVQQAVGIVQQVSPSPLYKASLPVAYSITGKYLWYRISAGSYSFNHNMKKAIFSAVMEPDNNSSAISPECPTGNCTFPVWSGESSRPLTHASLGVCSECTDVSSLITITSVDNSTGAPVYRLPNGMELEGRDPKPYIKFQGNGNLTWAESLVSAEQAGKLRYALANVTVFTMTTGNSSLTIAADNRDKLSPIAVSCSLYSCLRSYWGEVSNGRLVENLIDSKPLYPDVRSYQGDDSEEQTKFDKDIDYELKAEDCDRPSNVYWAAIQSPCLLNGTVFYTTENMSEATNVNMTQVRIISPDAAPDYPSALVPQGCLFEIQCFIGSRLKALLSGEIFTAKGYWNSRQGSDVWWDQWWLDPFWRNGTATATSISDRFSGIADAMTNQFRLGLGQADNSPGRIEGTALQTLAYTSVHWKWLLFPTILLAVETVLLAWAVGRSWWFRNDEVVWKNNLLPLYYFKRHFRRSDGSGPEGEDDEETVRPLMTIQEMEKDASHIMVKFVKPRKFHDVSDRDRDQESFIAGRSANND